MRLACFFCFDGSRKLTGIYQTGEVYAPGHAQFRRIADRAQAGGVESGQQGHITEQAFNRLINNVGKKDVTLEATDENGQVMVLAGAAVETEVSKRTVQYRDRLQDSGQLARSWRRNLPIEPGLRRPCERPARVRGQSHCSGWA